MNARMLERAQILLKVTAGWTAAEIASAFHVSASAAANTRVWVTRIVSERRLLMALNDITSLRESGLLEVSPPAR